MNQHEKVCNSCGYETTHKIEHKQHGGTQYTCRNCGHRVMYG